MMFLFYTCIIAILNSSPQKSNVKIHLVVNGQEVNIVSVYEPPNSDIFLSHYNKQVYLPNKSNNTFDLEIYLANSSFITIDINGEYRMPLALNVGDSISIVAERQVVSGLLNYEFTFSGSNALAHKYYIDRFFPPGKNYDYFEDLSKINSLDDFYISAKNYIDSLTGIWDSLKFDNLISDQVFELYEADTRASLYNEAIKKFSKVNKDDRSYESYINWLNLKQVMFYHADAANKILLRTPFGSKGHQLYLQNILTSDISINDSALKKSELGYHYYYDTAYRELAWGSYLYRLKEVFPSLDLGGQGQNLAVFEMNYPESIYLDSIRNFNDSILNERKNSIEPVVIDEYDYDSLAHILNQGDSRFIFIDVWATWCLPCISEFNSQTRLTKFLHSRDIKEVFLSVDSKSNLEKWRTFIVESHLPGNHYIINDHIETEILKILSKDDGKTSLFIPRYLLYDKKLDIFHIDLPRPSTGILLEKVIDNIIQESN